MALVPDFEGLAAEAGVVQGRTHLRTPTHALQVGDRMRVRPQPKHAHRDKPHFHRVGKLLGGTVSATVTNVRLLKLNPEDFPEEHRAKIAEHPGRLEVTVRTDDGEELVEHFSHHNDHLLIGGHRVASGAPLTSA